MSSQQKEAFTRATRGVGHELLSNKVETLATKLMQGLKRHIKTIPQRTLSRSKTELTSGSTGKCHRKGESM